MYLPPLDPKSSPLHPYFGSFDQMGDKQKTVFSGSKKGEIKCVIISQTGKGYGDLVCGIKIAEVLSQNGLYEHNIAISTKNPDQVPFKTRFTLIPLRKEPIYAWEPNIVIIGPDHSSLDFRENLLSIRSSEQDIQIILEIDEYDIAQEHEPLAPAEVVLGLGPRSTGIFLSTPLKVMHPLTYVANKIQKALLGSPFYFGYASADDTRDIFRKAVTALHPGEDLTFLFPGKQKENIVSNIPSGFTQILLTNLDTQTSSYKGEPGPLIHIIEGFVDREDIPYLLQASNSTTLATGDQSFSEAIATRKEVIIYEQHCFKVGLFTSYLNLFPEEHHKHIHPIDVDNPPSVESVVETISFLTKYPYIVQDVYDLIHKTRCAEVELPKALARILEGAYKDNLPTGQSSFTAGD